MGDPYTVYKFTLKYDPYSRVGATVSPSVQLTVHDRIITAAIIFTECGRVIEQFCQITHMIDALPHVNPCAAVYIFTDCIDADASSFADMVHAWIMEDIIWASHVVEYGVNGNLSQLRTRAIMNPISPMCSHRADCGAIEPISGLPCRDLYYAPNYDFDPFKRGRQERA